ncbi:ABC transporter substrate-binding protein [Mesorhizobium sp. 10J20-29]
MKIAGILLGAALSAAVFAPAAAQQEPTVVNIIMPLQRSIGFFPLLGGEALGYFEDEGVKANLLSSDTSLPFVAFLQNGQADIATLDGPETFAAITAGADVSVIFEAQQRVPEGIAVPADSPIKSVTELKGKIVGLASDRDINTLRWALSSVGSNADDIQTVVVGDAGPTLARALRDGTVAAVVGSLTDWGPIKANGIPVRIITPKEMAQAPSNNFVVLTSTLQDPAKRKAIVGFLRAWAKGSLVASIDRDALAAMSKAIVPEEWENEKFANEWLDSTIITMESVTEDVGQVQPQSWENLQNAMVDIGVVPGKVDLQGHLTNDLTVEANDFDREKVKADIAEWRAANMK